MSLVVPGSGQLYGGHWSSLAWFLGAGATIACISLLAPYIGQAGAVSLRAVTMIFLSIVSAEHAKRLLEPRLSTRAGRWWQNGNLSVTSVRAVGRGIDVRIEFRLNQSPAALWRVVSNLPNFLTIDPFHEQVIMMRKRPAVGVHLVLLHNAFGRRFCRYGKILSWRDGEQYAFSDLSRAGSSREFPHVFFVSVRPAGGAPLHVKPNSSKLTIRVRGKWTSTWIPAIVGRWWVLLVCREHGRLLRKAL